MAGLPSWSSATDGTRPESFSESGTSTTSCPPARGAMLGGAWFAAQAETNRARPPASAESRRNLDWSRVPGTAALILATREGSPAPAPLELLEQVGQPRLDLDVVGVSGPIVERERIPVPPLPLQVVQLLLPRVELGVQVVQGPHAPERA